MFKNLLCSLRILVGTVACLAVAGCGQPPTLHPYDKHALEMLQSLQPNYQLDYDGRVVELRLDGKHVTDEALELIKELTALRTLSLYGSSISDAGLENLKELGYLQALGLGATKITDKGIAHLEQVPALRWLWVTEDPQISEAALEKLRQAHPDLTIYQ
jgi:hypothetical protein